MPILMFKINLSARRAAQRPGDREGPHDTRLGAGMPLRVVAQRTDGIFGGRVYR